MHRREFLASSLAALGALSLPFGCARFPVPSRQRRVVSGNTSRDIKSFTDYDKLKAETVDGDIFLYDLLGNSMERFAVPLFCHGFSQSPVTRDWLIGSEKWGECALVFNLRTKAVAKILHAPEGYRFFGHSRFTPDGTRVLFSASFGTEVNGALLVYRAGDWSLEKIVPTVGANPHELIFDSSGRILLAQGNPPGMQTARLSVLDPISLRAEKEFFLDQASHVVQLSKDEFVVGSVARQDKCYLCKVNVASGAVLDFRHSPQFVPGFHGEALSLAAVSDSHVLVTLDGASKVLLWNTANNTADYITFGGPQTGGVFNAGNGEILVSLYSHPTAVYTVKLDSDLEKFRSGSRLLRWKNSGNGRHFVGIEMPDSV